MPDPVGVLVLFPPPMLITDPSVDAETVAFADPVLPDNALVRVANVLPSKSEGTVTEPPNSPPVSCLWVPVKVMTDGDAVDELLWPVTRLASHSKDRVEPIMIDVGLNVNIAVYYVAQSQKMQWYQRCRNSKVVKIR